MKISTEDCIKAIVNFYKDALEGSSLKQESEWKRTSKAGNKKDGFTRKFQNRQIPKVTVIVKSTETDITELEEVIDGKAGDNGCPSQATPKWTAGAPVSATPPVDDEDFLTKLANSPATIKKVEQPVAKPKGNGSNYYFDPDEENNAKEFPKFWIVKKEFWNQNHHFDDGERLQEVGLPDGFYESMESQVEYHKKDEKTAMQKLLDAGLTLLPDSKWKANKDEDEEEEEDDPNVKYPTLAELKANPITVPLKIEDDHEDDLSGRIIYDLGDDRLESDSSFDFYCGPETEDGCLDDRSGGFGNDEKLEKLFADFGDKIWIQSAENSHQVNTFSGISVKDLWGVVKERLERSGAVLMEGGHDGSEDEDDDDDEEGRSENTHWSKQAEDAKNVSSLIQFEVDAEDGAVRIKLYEPAKGMYLDEKALFNINYNSKKISNPKLDTAGIAYVEYDGTIADCKAFLNDLGYEEHLEGQVERNRASDIKNAKFDASKWVFCYAGEAFDKELFYILRKSYWNKHQDIDDREELKDLAIVGFPEEFTPEYDATFSWQGVGGSKAGLEWLRFHGVEEVVIKNNCFCRRR